MAKERKAERVSRKDGKNCFVEVLDTAFELGKIRLDFVSYDVKAAAGSRQTANISIYVDADKFLALVEKARRGGKEYISYCKAHPEYKDPFFLTMGGISARTLAARGAKRPDGKSLSRTMTISSSKKGYFLTAKSGPGEENDTGLIVPKYSEPEEKVSLAFDHDALMELLIMTEARYNAYLAADYILNPISAREKPTTKSNNNTHSSAPTPAPAQKAAPAPAPVVETADVTDDDLPF